MSHNLSKKDDFFKSQASNYMVSVAAKVGKIEGVITKSLDSEALVILYNVVQSSMSLLEQELEKIENTKKSEER